jgi:hypothetical protein
MDAHKQTKGRYRSYHMPRTAYSIQRGTVNFDGVSIDGVLQLKASALLNGKSVIGSLTFNFHDYRISLYEAPYREPFVA